MPMRIRRPQDLQASIEVFQRAVHEIAAGEYTPGELGARAPEPPDIAAWSRLMEDLKAWTCEIRGRIAGFLASDTPGHVRLLPGFPAHGRCRRAAGHGNRRCRPARRGYTDHRSEPHGPRVFRAGRLRRAARRGGHPQRRGTALPHDGAPARLHAPRRAHAAAEAAILALRRGGRTSPVAAFMTKPGSAISTRAEGSAALAAAANSAQGREPTPIIAWNLSCGG